MFRLIDPPSRWRSYVWPGVSLLLIIGLHAAIISGLYSASPALDRPAEPPAISGLLIAAPPTETVQAPAPSEASPAPQPEPKPKPKTEPIPEPKPSLEPTPAPEPEPEPEPPVQQEPEPPSEPEPESQPDTESNEPAREQRVDIETDPADSTGAPIVAPSSQASHLNNPSPAYPRRAIRLGQEGLVIIDVFILADGSVGELRLAKSSGYDRLDEAALEAVSHWHYVPATQNGQPIDYWYQQPVTFNLK